MKDGFSFREHLRKPLAAEIEVGDSFQGGDLYFSSQDVSEGGVFLHSDLLLQEGEVIWLRFELPEIALAVRTRGRVVRVQKDDVPGMGIKFLDLNESERAALSAWLEDS